MLGALHVAFVQALIGSDLPGLQCLAWASIVRADDDRTGERAHCQFASQVGTDECDVQLDNRTTVTFSLCSETPNHCKNRRDLLIPCQRNMALWGF
ncbi:hypothetical protein CABS01_14990 [Colletotrichum abscissum]|uniref:uncharacterized protein n=1 Tax=Colletotrichum abscissum TaxID=1671311 RepID=UPI0027D582F1|nr:uncharacterized protein CABS01_14990 [Colletotrichum abscissum]KAK1477523.1 hypothetical protein CABS01_14990 [Colletotrichum abscissum]